MRYVTHRNVTGAKMFCYESRPQAVLTEIDLFCINSEIHESIERQTKTTNSKTGIQEHVAKLLNFWPISIAVMFIASSLKALFNIPPALIIQMINEACLFVPFDFLW